MYNIHSSSKPTRFILLLLLARIARLANAEGRKTDVASGQYELQSGTLARSYLLHVPKQLTHAAPRVIVMDGYTSSADSSTPYLAMNDVADEEGFDLVYLKGAVDQQGSAFFLCANRKACWLIVHHQVSQQPKTTTNLVAFNALIVIPLHSFIKQAGNRSDSILRLSIEKPCYNSCPLESM